MCEPKMVPTCLLDSKNYETTWNSCLLELSGRLNRVMCLKFGCSWVSLDVVDLSVEDWVCKRKRKEKTKGSVLTLGWLMLAWAVLGKGIVCLGSITVCFRTGGASALWIKCGDPGGEWRRGSQAPKAGGFSFKKGEFFSFLSQEVLLLRTHGIVGL